MVFEFLQRISKMLYLPFFESCPDKLPAVDASRLNGFNRLGGGFGATGVFSGVGT